MKLQEYIKIIGARLPSNGMEHGAPLLKILEFLSETDILHLYPTSMSVYGLMKRCIGMYLRTSKPLQH